MQAHKREVKRLADAGRAVDKAFGPFGVNKRRELVRLLYEISKREDGRPSYILKALKNDVPGPRDFGKVKKYLLSRRFPTQGALPSKNFYLPKLSINADDAACLKRGRFSPTNIFYEKGLKDSFVFHAFRSRFPKAFIADIHSLKGYVEQNAPFGVPDYNRRAENIFIVNQREGFFKRCPCTKGAKRCGYSILNLGFGCIFECTYCYLQEYTNSPGIILPANPERFFDEFYKRKDLDVRIGTGEFTDSLMLDDITEYSSAIIDFFNGKKVLFEFKTKSANISNILKQDHSGNIVVSWSLNPQKIIDNNEFFTAGLAERLDAAKRCAAAGYKVGFHFDPIIYRDGWRRLYADVIDRLYAKINERHIAWISLGTLRFKPQTKNIIERRFPGNSILDGELIYGHDSKLRYPDRVRYEVYKYMLTRIRRRYGNVWIYPCMEDKKMWKSLDSLL
jgi:spore photoproduct lyase